RERLPLQQLEKVRAQGPWHRKVTRCLPPRTRGKCHRHHKTKRRRRQIRTQRLSLASPGCTLERSRLVELCMRFFPSTTQLSSLRRRTTRSICSRQRLRGCIL